MRGLHEAASDPAVLAREDGDVLAVGKVGYQRFLENRLVEALRAFEILGRDLKPGDRRRDGRSCGGLGHSEGSLRRVVAVWTDPSKGLLTTWCQEPRQQLMRQFRET